MLIWEVTSSKSGYHLQGEESEVERERWLPQTSKIAGFLFSVSEKMTAQTLIMTNWPHFKKWQRYW